MRASHCIGLNDICVLPDRSRFYCHCFYVFRLVGWEVLGCALEPTWCNKNDFGPHQLVADTIGLGTVQYVR